MATNVLRSHLVSCSLGSFCVRTKASRQNLEVRPPPATHSLFKLCAMRGDEREQPPRVLCGLGWYMVLIIMAR